MTAETLRQLVKAEPFRPLRLHLTGGTEFEIRSPEQVLLGHAAVIVDLPWQFYGERRAVIGLRQVQWVEEMLLPQ
jgi:hypothetical protein